MIDREKVIKGLNSCAKWMGKNDGDACNSCPYHSHFSYDDNNCIAMVNSEAIALMKEQEAEIKRLKRPDCEHANHDGAGCLGYSGCEQDDEPIDACKQCEKYTGNICAEY